MGPLIGAFGHLDLKMANLLLNSLFVLCNEAKHGIEAGNCTRRLERLLTELEGILEGFGGFWGNFAFCLVEFLTKFLSFPTIHPIDCSSVLAKSPLDFRRISGIPASIGVKNGSKLLGMILFWGKGISQKRSEQSNWPIIGSNKIGPILIIYFPKK